MGLFFGRKRKERREEKRYAEVMREHDLVLRQAAEMEAFDRSRDGQAIKRHFELSERLRTAPVSQQEAIAREMISFSTQAAKALMAKERLWDRQLTEMKIPHDPPRLPAHAGFERLAIDHERAKRYDQAIAACLEAKRQGWNGAWDKRIERCQLKKAKQEGSGR